MNTRVRVEGIGGVFFRTRDPVALAAWYREHLGVPVLWVRVFFGLTAVFGFGVVLYAAFEVALGIPVPPGLFLD